MDTTPTATPLARSLGPFGISPPVYTAYGAGCGATPAPALNGSQLPVVGQPFSLSLANLPGGRIGTVATGGSDQVFGSVPLPLDLTLLGMPGCSLLMSPDTTSFIIVPPSGSMTWGFTIPTVLDLLGGTFFNQAFVLDPFANPLGVAVTNGGKGVVGGQ